MGSRIRSEAALLIDSATEGDIAVRVATQLLETTQKFYRFFLLFFSSLYGSERKILALWTQSSVKVPSSWAHFPWTCSASWSTHLSLQVCPWRLTQAFFDLTGRRAWCTLVNTETIHPCMVQRVHLAMLQTVG